METNNIMKNILLLLTIVAVAGMASCKKDMANQASASKPAAVATKPVVITTGAYDYQKAIMAKRTLNPSKQ